MGNRPNRRAVDALRMPFYSSGHPRESHGSLDEIKSDIQATRDIGADELFIDPGLSGITSVEVYLEVMEQMKDQISIGGGG